MNNKLIEARERLDRLECEVDSLEDDLTKQREVYESMVDLYNSQYETLMVTYREVTALERAENGHCRTLIKQEEN